MKSARVAAFIVEGCDFPTSRLFAAARRVDQEGCDFVGQGYRRGKIRSIKSRGITPPPLCDSLAAARWRGSRGTQIRESVTRVLGHEERVWRI
jgi:hypothetical protein